MKEIQLNIEEIPWSRIVHWYGRATKYPMYFATLKTGNIEEQKEALNKIKSTIEHQDTIIQVTPFALPFIYELLLEEHTGKKGVLEIINAVIDAVIFQYGYIDKALPPNKKTAKELISKAFLWPPFENEDEDEYLWETYSYKAKDWVFLTINILLEKESELKTLELISEPVEELKNGILKKKKELRLLTRNKSHK